jgi:hypothetical protein
LNSCTVALGELIGEERGKITGQRVLDVQVPKMETSFTMEGNYRGTPCTDVGTYAAELREGGVLFGEGQGITTTKDGQGIATWTGPGIGRFTGPGKVSFRGSLFFRIPSTSEGGKLSYLNNMMGVFEYEVDEAGNCSVKTWERK